MKKQKRLLADITRRYGDSKAPPSCAHFGECGGCLFQDIEYGAQLLIKRDYLNRIFQGVYTFDRVHPSTPFRYRNRMDFVTAFGSCGLRKRGSHRSVVDIGSCCIAQERADGIFQRIRPLLAEVQGYDYLSHTGYLRYLVIRQARFTGELMVSFVVAERENRLQAVIERVLELADSVTLLFNNGLADTSFGSVLETVRGGCITERFDDVAFSITPNSFFQSNSDIALNMYREIRDAVAGSVLDLYSGIGGISLFIADACETVTGVESLPEAVESAQANKTMNRRENVTFICSDAHEYLKALDERFDTVVLDPPRSGMNPRSVKYLEGSGAETIVYMSCNPVTFLRDFRLMESYAIERIEAFDMFPQTPHLETLAVLRRRQ